MRTSRCYILEYFVYGGSGGKSESASGPPSEPKSSSIDRTGLGANRKTPERRVASVLSVSEAAKGGCKRYSVVGWGRMVSGAVGARVERVRVRWCAVGSL
jgi:hypothetical protein